MKKIDIALITRLLSHPPTFQAVFRFFSEDDEGAWKEKNSLARFFIFAP